MNSVQKLSRKIFTTKSIKVQQAKAAMLGININLFSPDRWPPLPTTTRSLPSSDARTNGPRSQSLCPHGRTHSDRPGSSRGSHHCDRAAGGNVPDVTGADRVSALSAGNRHPHLPRRRPHEHTLLPLLRLRRVSSGAHHRGRAGAGEQLRLCKCYNPVVVAF